MTPEGGASAHTLAHNAHRIEVAIEKLMGLSSSGPLSTHIYALHHATYVRLAQADGSYGPRLSPPFGFVARDAEAYVLMDAGRSNQSEGAYLGLAQSVLARQQMRFPDWFAMGFARLISKAYLRGSKVIVGEPDPWIARVLLSQRLGFIPMRRLLTMSPDDPALRRRLMAEKYSAECWLLVHAITVEGLQKSEFARYLQLLSEHKSAADAFAASFQVSYEELDRRLGEIITKRMVRTLAIEVPDQPDSEQPRPLASAEAKEKIIQLAEALKGGQPLQSNLGRSSGGNPRVRSFARFRAPGGTRTPDPRLRRPMLYPPELRAQLVGIIRDCPGPGSACARARNVRNVIEYRNTGTGGTLCCHSQRASPCSR